jgi:hypothetical protein
MQKVSRDEYPLLSRRKNGDRLYGFAGPLGEDLYAAGTPPVWGLSARAVRAQRIVDVRPGDELMVERGGDHWVVSDARGYLGVLRWRPALDGYRNAVTGAVIISYPSRGTLHVQRVVLNRDGWVVDFGGVVIPVDAPS